VSVRSCFCEVQAPRLQVLQRRHAVLLEKDAAQVAFADAEPLGERGDAGRFTVRGLGVEAERGLARSVRDASITVHGRPGPGAISGRHFMQGRKVAASACAAVAKKRQFFFIGVRTRQIGRQ
jgi:hypothetical protein